MQIRSKRGGAGAVVAVAAFALIAASCGSKSSSSTTAAPASTEAAATTAAPASTEAPATTAAPAVNLDSNGDGKVQFGLAIAGPKDDGAYYQALVDGVAKFTKAHGFPDAIVVDNVKAESAAQSLGDLAQQNVDVVVVGSSEIAGPLKDLTTQYDKLFWYCNCGAGFQQLPGLAQSLDDGAEVGFTAGYAAGLVMKAKGAKNLAFIGCCDLPFEKEAYLSTEAGMQAVDPALTLTYYKSGAFQFDFNNTAGATTAYNTAKAAGAGAVDAYLGGAHEPIVKLANADNLITMTAGRSNGCERTDIKYDIAVRFDGGDYILAAMSKILAGTFKEGESYTFHVGVDAEPGAKICNASADETTAMDTLYKDIAAGKYKDTFGAIKGKAYGG
jgi:basic membrane protein A